MYRCDWDSCQFKFWSVIDLERHARRHLEAMGGAGQPELVPEGTPSVQDQSQSQSQSDGHLHCKPKTTAAPQSPSVVVRTLRPMRSKFTLDSDAEQEDDIVCIVCASGRERPGNQVVLCDECDRAFHQKCHLPEIAPAIVADKHAAWFCRGCVPKQ